MRRACLAWLLALGPALACGGSDAGGGTAGGGALGGAHATGGMAGLSSGGSAGSGGTGGDASSCTGADVFVSPSGSGDACSCAAPCALLTGRDHARALAAAMTKDVVVELAGGDYRLTAPFELDASDSGRNGHEVIYRAGAGQVPVLNGATRVTGFTPVDAKIFAANVPANAKSRELWVDGRRATRARSALAPAGFSKTSTGFALGDPSIAAWPDRTSLEVVGTHAWKMFRCPVSAADASGLVVAEPCWSATQSQAGVTFDSVAWLENARELLDEAGEFFLDETTHTLYYAPRAGEDLSQADVELPLREELVHAEGTPAAPLHDLAFEGIHFSYATWLAPSTNDGYASLQATITLRGSPPAPVKPLANVLLHATHDVRFSGSELAHLGGAALAFEVGAQNNRVEGCRFEDVSASAIMIGDVTHTDDHHPSDPALVVKDNAVTGSYVTRAGAEYYDAVGLFVGYTTHTTLESNELFDLPYSGISVGWGWGGVDPGGSGGYTTPSTSQSNLIDKNVVSHHLRELRDGGGIYVLGAQNGSSMSGNVIANQANAFGNLYLDNGTQGYDVSQNLVLLYSKQDAPAPDPDRSYWLYVQVYDPVATNNVVGANFTNDATPFTPKPIDPSNSVAAPTLVGADLSPASAVVAGAGSPLVSPVVSDGKPATASSVYDAGHPAEQANDGSAFDGWSPSGTDPSPWWQVDLGAGVAIDQVDVVSRWAIDQPSTRRSYRVIASDDPSFASSSLLGAVDATGLPHRAIFSTRVTPAVKARYVRVEKTASEYFFLGEVRVHGK